MHGPYCLLPWQHVSLTGIGFLNLKTQNPVAYCLLPLALSSDLNMYSSFI